jgi:hypothetical protein
MENSVPNSGLQATTRPAYDRGPVSWAETLAGAALFLALGANLILEKIPMTWNPAARLPLWNASIWILLLLPAAGVATGWIWNFPRWTYPYAGLALLTGLYLSNASTPGLSLFGVPFFGRELWGGRAFIPLLLACGTGLLVTRSFRPLYVLFDRAAHDLTLISFALIGGQWLWWLMCFDGMEWRFALPWLALLILLLAGASAAYLRSRGAARRVASLVAGILLSMAVSTVVSTLYWLEDGGVDFAGMALLAGPVLIAMLAPALIELSRLTDEAAGT